MTKLHAPKLFCCQNPLFTPVRNDLIEMKLLFDKAVAESNSNNIIHGNETSLRLYSLYKQATEGDFDLKAPAYPFDYSEQAKFDAWASLKGKSIQEAQIEFIMLVYELKN